MFALVYLSAAHPNIKSDELESIVRTSARNNWGKEITGILIYIDGLFFQVLEGPESNVRELFDHISKDNRHREVQILDAREINERFFPDWSMAFRNQGLDPLVGVKHIDSIQDIASFETLFSQPQHIVNQWLKNLNHLLPLPVS